MNRTHLVAVVVLSLIALVFAFSQSPLQSAQTRQTATTTEVGQTRVTATPQQQAQLQKTVATQQRLNRYFHADVIPKLKSCWSSVQGKGSISLEHNYKKGPDGRWATTGVALIKSALPRGQEAIALRCMQGATRGTSFPAEGSDGATTYTIRWTWPVPFPANAAQLTSTMFAARADNGGAGGGCDGRGAAASCYICSTDGGDLSCKTVCSGYKACRITDLKGGNKTCGAKDSGACASGGPLGVGGGGIIF